MNTDRILLLNCSQLVLTLSLCLFLKLAVLTEVKQAWQSIDQYQKELPFCGREIRNCHLTYENLGQRGQVIRHHLNAPIPACRINCRTRFPKVTGGWRAVYYGKGILALAPDILCGRLSSAHSTQGSFIIHYNLQNSHLKISVFPARDK